MWYSAVRLHRFAAGARHSQGATVVLAHIIDERRERQVTRREAAAWAQQVGVPYFEMVSGSSSERPCPRVLTHLASAVLLRDGGAEAAGASQPKLRS